MTHDTSQRQGHAAFKQAGIGATGTRNCFYGQHHVGKQEGGGNIRYLGSLRWFFADCKAAYAAKKARAA